MRIIKIATRESKLSLRQVELFLEELKRKIDFKYEIVFVKTKGDIYSDIPPYKIGSKGIFEKEVNLAVLNGLADIAIHSLKDIPTDVSEDLELLGTLKRETPFDCLVSKEGENLRSLKKGAKIGTSSIRRKLALRILRRDLDIVDLRGNVDTRIKKLKEGYFDALVLAEAGLKRLGYNYNQRFSEYEITPAPCQGIIGIYGRRRDEEIKRMVALVNDENTYLEAQIERRLVKEIGGGCYTALGVYSKVLEGYVKIVASLYFEDEKRTLEVFGRLENLDPLLSKLVGGLR